MDDDDFDVLVGFAPLMLILIAIVVGIIVSP